MMNKTQIYVLVYLAVTIPLVIAAVYRVSSVMP